MKVQRKVAWVVAVGALISAGEARADFAGISVFQEAVGGPGTPPGGNPRWIWRIYADMTSPADRINVWGGGGNLGPCVIQNVLADGVTPGSGFTNIGGASGQFAPAAPGTTRDWDSYMTVGVLYGQESPGGIDPIILVPGSPDFISGTTWTAPVDGGGVLITPNDPQGRADYRVSGNDTNLRVLLMQLVVNAGEYIRGTIGVHWNQHGVPQSGGYVQGVQIPAPGALPLLGAAMLCPRKRSRRR